MPWRTPGQQPLVVCGGLGATPGLPGTQLFGQHGSCSDCRIVPQSPKFALPVYPVPRESNSMPVVQFTNRLYLMWLRRPCQQRYRCHLEKNATQIAAIGVAAYAAQHQPGLDVDEVVVVDGIAAHLVCTSRELRCQPLLLRRASDRMPSRVLSSTVVRTHRRGKGLGRFLFCTHQQPCCQKPDKNSLGCGDVMSMCQLTSGSQGRSGRGRGCGGRYSLGRHCPGPATAGPRLK